MLMNSLKAPSDSAAVRSSDRISGFRVLILAIYLVPFVLLHLVQRTCRFSVQEPPPRDLGKMWSMLKNRPSVSVGNVNDTLPLLERWRRSNPVTPQDLQR